MFFLALQARRKSFYAPFAYVIYRPYVESLVSNNEAFLLLLNEKQG